MLEIKFRPRNELFSSNIDFDQFYYEIFSDELPEYSSIPILFLYFRAVGNFHVQFSEEKKRSATVKISRNVDTNTYTLSIDDVEVSDFRIIMGNDKRRLNELNSSQIFLLLKMLYVDCSKCHGKREKKLFLEESPEGGYLLKMIGIFFNCAFQLLKRSYFFF